MDYDVDVCVVGGGPGGYVAAIRVTVRAAQMRQVRFSVKGRPARTVNVAPGARRISVLVALRPRGAPVQKVTTRITFRNGARPRTLATVARRCSSGAVLPQFTG